jgi:hypothetical protein
MALLARRLRVRPARALEQRERPRGRAPGQGFVPRHALRTPPYLTHGEQHAPSSCRPARRARAGPVRAHVRRRKADRDDGPSHRRGRTHEDTAHAHYASHGHVERRGVVPPLCPRGAPYARQMGGPCRLIRSRCVSTLFKTHVFELTTQVAQVVEEAFSSAWSGSSSSSSSAASARSRPVLRTQSIRSSSPMLMKRSQIPSMSHHSLHTTIHKLATIQVNWS